MRPIDKHSGRKLTVIGPALTMGGMERASVNLANAFNRLGFDVTYIAVLRQKHFFKLNNNIRFFEPASFNTTRMSIWKTLRYLRSSVKHEQPDAVIVFNKFYAALTVIALAFTRTRVFISERSSPLYPWGLLFRFIHAFAFTLFPPEGIVAQTKVAATYQRSYYRKRSQIKVIPNAVREVKLSPDVIRKKKVLAVGRLDEFNKGFDQLIRAFAPITNPEWTLSFAGNDQHAGYLKELVASLGIENRVEFLGVRTDMDMVFAEVSIFVIPSRSEGFPNALCEAMAAGLPCISFDFMAGPREIIDHNVNGIIVENQNVAALTQAICSLMANPAERQRLGSNAMTVRSKYEELSIAKSYVEFMLDQVNEQK